MEQKQSPERVYQLYSNLYNLYKIANNKEKIQEFLKNISHHTQLLSTYNNLQYGIKEYLVRDNDFLQELIYKGIFNMKELDNNHDAIEQMEKLIDIYERVVSLDDVLYNTVFDILFTQSDYSSKDVMVRFIEILKLFNDYGYRLNFDMFEAIYQELYNIKDKELLLEYIVKEYFVKWINFNQTETYATIITTIMVKQDYTKGFKTCLDVFGKDYINEIYTGVLNSYDYEDYILYRNIFKEYLIENSMRISFDYAIRTNIRTMDQTKVYNLFREIYTNDLLPCSLPNDEQNCDTDHKNGDVKHDDNVDYKNDDNRSILTPYKELISKVNSLSYIGILQAIPIKYLKSKCIELSGKVYPYSDKEQQLSQLMNIVYLNIDDYVVVDENKDTIEYIDYDKLLLDIEDMSGIDYSEFKQYVIEDVMKEKTSMNIAKIVYDYINRFEVF